VRARDIRKCNCAGYVSFQIVAAASMKATHYMVLCLGVGIIRAFKGYVLLKVHYFSTSGDSLRSLSRHPVIVLPPKDLFFYYLTNFVAQEPEGSSPHSQQPATGPCPQTVESNPHPPSQSP
jgi:hypothetical protein